MHLLTHTQTLKKYGPRKYTQCLQTAHELYKRERKRGTHTPKTAPKQDPRVPPPQSPELQRGWGTEIETETQVNTTSLELCIRRAHVHVCVAYTPVQ